MRNIVFHPNSNGSELYRWNTDSNQWEWWSYLSVSWIPSKVFTKNYSPSHYKTVTYDDTWAEPTE